MTGSEKDAGFCSGFEEDDISNLHSPSASEDSLEVQVMPISLKNKRKLAEPRKIREGISAPLKKRKYEHVEEQTVPDEESSRTVRSPNPFRPWSCTSKNVADSKLITVTEKNTNQLSTFSSTSNESTATSIISSHVNHRHHHYHHRYHYSHHHHYPTSGSDNREDDRNNDDDNNKCDQDHASDLNGENGERDTSEKQCEGKETLPGRQRQDKTRAVRIETDFAAASTKITTPETTLSSSAAASSHPRLQEEPLSLVLRGDVAARVPSHPAVNGSYEKSYSVECANVSSASSSISSSSSSSCSSTSSSPSPSFSSLSSGQQNHRTRSNGENSCSTTTVSITSTITRPTTTVTGIQSGQPTRQYSTAGQQRNYKNMTRERRIEANARERTRVHTISAAFDTLRRAIPAYSHNQKLSKLSVLRIACSYIMTLGNIVNTPEGEPANGDSLGACVDLVSRTIQTEGKLRKRKED
ncbi:uncharacterized protein DDB_G0271670-like isoform X2 [Ceratina calcarata]|nr:uncharacterized protein DDB_G0271670-like isoform X2 [Ceratina calcarata]XP_026672958.1 uncharacterized protein DDB_G0271670-like isoform X2 [Ceratina calcarata]